MKFSDLNENLTEGPLSGPAGFGRRAKAKLQKNIPFAKQQQRRGKLKDEQHKEAKNVKNDLKAWMSKAFADTNGEKEDLKMGQFIGWAKKYNAPLGAAIEAIALSDKDYKAFAGKEDPKVKVRDDDPDATGDKSKKVDAPSDEGDLELEQEPEVADEEVEEEVDMSASIYEARLRAFLNEDQEGEVIWNEKTLHDNQIDTLIVKALAKVQKGGAGESEKPKDSEVSKAADKVSKAKASDDEEMSVSSASSGGSSFDEYADELEDILGAIKNDQELTKQHKRNAKIIFNEIFY